MSISKQKSTLDIVRVTNSNNESQEYISFTSDVDRIYEKRIGKTVNSKFLEIELFKIDI
ncbi:22017_t:CDS:2 [Rhizophagus irregularis]|nr:22017_t:CDS:2 [Rhizophagus irregularis]